MTILDFILKIIATLSIAWGLLVLLFYLLGTTEFIFIAIILSIALTAVYMLILIWM